MIKQYIVVRKDAKTVHGGQVSAQKLAVMVAHASMAFLSHKIIDNAKDKNVNFQLDDDSYEWMTGIFTKVLLEAKNLHALERTVELAKEHGFVEGKDYFLIKDNCLTELVPDLNSDRCFIAIGFRPMDTEKIHEVVKRLQLYR